MTYARFVLGVPANRHSEVREGLSQEFFFLRLRSCGVGGEVLRERLRSRSGLGEERWIFMPCKTRNILLTQHGIGRNRIRKFTLA